MYRSRPTRRSIAGLEDVLREILVQQVQRIQ